MYVYIIWVSFRYLNNQYMITIVIIQLYSYIVNINNIYLIIVPLVLLMVCGAHMCARAAT